MEVVSDIQSKAGSETGHKVQDKTYIGGTGTPVSPGLHSVCYNMCPEVYTLSHRIPSLWRKSYQFNEWKLLNRILHSGDICCFSVYQILDLFHVQRLPCDQIVESHGT